jgi:hypothetical protein
LVLLLTASICSAQTAPGPKLGAGAFFGMSFPVLQEDQGNGTEFGLKGRFGLANTIVLEPFFASTSWGEPDPIDDFDLGIEGSKVTAFGIEASLGNLPGQMGVSPFFFAGIGSYKVKNDDTGFDESSMGYSGGLGVGIGLSPMFSLDLRGKFMVIPMNDGSKKSIGVVAGVNFAFGAK